MSRGRESESECASGGREREREGNGKGRERARNMRKGSELRKEQGREREEGSEKREFEKKLGTCLLVQILYQPPISVVSTRFVPISFRIRKTLCHAVTLLSAQNTQICNYVTDHVKYFCSVNPLKTQKFVTM